MDEFAKKVRSAAAAGWWTLLAVYIILLIQWFVYLLVMANQPAVLLCLMGKGVTWPQIQTVWLWGMVRFKLGAGTMLFVVIWLTLWAKRLREK